MVVNDVFMSGSSSVTADHPDPSAIWATADGDQVYEQEFDTSGSFWSLDTRLGRLAPGD